MQQNPLIFVKIRGFCVIFVEFKEENYPPTSCPLPPASKLSSYLLPLTSHLYFISSNSTVKISAE